MANLKLRTILDVCVPAPFRHALTGYEVFTSSYLGLRDFGDTGVLDALERKFDVFLTCDHGIPWQQNFAGRKITIFILKTKTNKLEDLRGLVPNLPTALKTLKPGAVVKVTD